MDSVKKDDSLEANAFLDSIDLDKDIEKIYELLGDDDVQDEFANQSKLSKFT